MPDTRDAVDPLEALAAEEAQERAAIDAAHAANQEEQRAQEAAQRAAADAGEESEDEDELEQEVLEQDKEERLYAGKYRTVEEMERAYSEAQSTIGRLGNELGQARQGGGQEATPVQQPQGEQQMSKEEMDEWMVEDPVAATFYLAQLAAAAQAEQQAQLLQPVIAQVNNAAASSALEQVKRELGPSGEALLEENREALIAVMEADRDHFVDPATRVRHMREAVLAAAWERGNLPARDAKPSATKSRRRGADGQFAPDRDVHVEGGSGAQPRTSGNGREPELSAEERELQQLHPVTGWHRPVDEKGIPLPSGPLG